MAYVKLAISEHHFIGASTDTKPIGVPIGSICIEYDTYKVYITYDGTNWEEMPESKRLANLAGKDFATQATLALIKAKTDNIVISTQVSKYAVAMTSANTEYSQPLTNVKKFRIHTRDYTAFRLAYETGKVATPTDPYETITDGCEKYEGDLNIPSLTLYFASSVAGKTAEIEVWS